jgi:hypothetical protein
MEDLPTVLSFRSSAFGATLFGRPFISCSCAVYKWTPAEASRCVGKSTILFVGDAFTYVVDLASVLTFACSTEEISFVALLTLSVTGDHVMRTRTRKID